MDLVHLGGYNSIPQTGGLINNKNSFLTILGAVESKIKTPADLVSGEDPLLGPQMAIFSLCPHMAERQGSSLGSLL